LAKAQQQAQQQGQGGVPPQRDPKGSSGSEGRLGSLLKRIPVGGHGNAEKVDGKANGGLRVVNE